MKNLFYLTIASILVFSCNKPVEKISKTWLDQPIDFYQIQEVVNTYHMFDSTDTKVGSMIFGFSFEDGFLVARDTSQFDDGSVYETAEFTLDTSSFKMKKLAIDMKTAQASIDIDLNQTDKITGTYILSRDTLSNEYPIDSAYQHDVIRGELYMLFYTLQLKENDSISFKVLAPTSMAISEASLSHEGTEKIETAAGSFQCDVLWLKSDGIMPSNKIWISKSEPRKVVKFYVPGPEFAIELVSSK